MKRSVGMLTTMVQLLALGERGSLGSCGEVQCCDRVWFQTFR